MRSAFIVAAAAGFLISSTASAEVKVTMKEGLVSISAKNATVTQILSEWARVGQTRIINAERVTGGPLTLELTDVSELQALDVLLRGAGGYVIAGRAVPSANTSQFDRILIVPPSANVARPPAAAAAAAQPAFQPPRMIAPQLPADPDEPGPPPNAMSEPVRFPQVRPAGLAPPAMAPTTPPPDATPAWRTPSSPFGTARPGMVVPAPAPPQTQQADPQ